MSCVFSYKTVSISTQTLKTVSSSSSLKFIYNVPETIFINKNRRRFGLYGLAKDINDKNTKNIIKGTNSILIIYEEKHNPKKEKNIEHFQTKKELINQNNQNNQKDIKNNSFNTPSKIITKIYKTSSKKYADYEINIYKKLKEIIGYENHICEYFGHKLIHNNYYLTMEYIPTDLFDYIFRDGNKYNYKQAVDYMRQLVDALLFLHENDIIYNDLKLENIMLFKDTQKIKLIDFDCCTNIKKPETGSGTVEYMSPELLKCYIKGSTYNTLTFKSDVWGFGLILCILITHMQPYENKNIRIAIKNIMTNQYNNNWDECYKFININNRLSGLTSIDRKNIANLMCDCLQSDPTKRASFRDIKKLF